MRIIINIRDTAALSRIQEFGNCLERLQEPKPDDIEGFPDVIKKISKDW